MTQQRNAPGPELRAAEVTLGYGDRPVVEGLDLRIRPGQITAIIGANACGKSTLLRALSRLLRPSHGAVILDGRDVARLPTRHVARRLGLLPQSPDAPDGITVADLVARGRHPHQRWWQHWSAEDQEAVEGALEATGTAGIARRFVDQLSGGQRQRVWIAMTLAQGTELLLLDEPTTHLDIAHQVEVLDLLSTLNEEEGRTVVVVLHDLNQACRYAHHLVAMRDGRVVAEGTPNDVVTRELVREIFHLDVVVTADPVTGTPLIVPARPGSRQRGPAGSETVREPASDSHWS